MFKITIDGKELSAQSVDINILTEQQNNKSYPYKIYDEDFSVDVRQSMPSNLNIPLGIQDYFDVEYLGHFRITGNDGDSNSNHACGVIDYNKNNNSLFFAGHNHHDAIAEFSIPAELDKRDIVDKNTPNCAQIQPFTRLLDGVRNDKINGIHIINGDLYVTSEHFYDADNSITHNLQVLNPDDIANSDKTLYIADGKAHYAGYLMDIPDDAKGLLGGDYAMGWGTVYSIVSRYSIGPSLTVLDKFENGRLTHKPKLFYPFDRDHRDRQLTPRGQQMSDDAPDPLWNGLTDGRAGFIIPNTNIFMVLGTNGGFHTGYGYKTQQIKLDGTEITCQGPCSAFEYDNYNYYWMYDIRDIAKAKNVWEPKPFNHGIWTHPFDSRQDTLRGATYDIENNILYVSIKGAGAVGRFDHPPLIVAYKLNFKQ